MPAALMINKKSLILFIFSVTLILFIARPGSADGTRTITGLDGEEIEIPACPERIACFYHPAYDKIVMLSSGSRIAMLPGDATPWAYRYYPELKGIITQKTEGLPDLERLLALNVDLVFYPKGKINISQVVEAKIPVVCPYTDNVAPTDIDEYMTEFKRQIMFFGEILGDNARKRAERYCIYLDEINSKVKAITSKIPESDKPKVYYGRATDLYSTQGSNTIMKWYTEFAGGIYLPKELKKYYPTVNREQVISWDPDIILLGMNGAFNSETDEAKLKEYRAYRSGKVYKIPAGIFYWDMTSCETALLPLYLGKKFHPESFKDWDIMKEMKRFYLEIYKIDMTDADAERILNGMPPG